MTTDIAQAEEISKAREPLPPVEMNVEQQARVEEQPAGSPATNVPHTVAPAQAPTQQQPEPAKQPAKGIAGWLSRNRWFTKDPVTNLGYQFTRATAATIPYGFGMAAGHHAFGMLSAKGQKMGYTQEGIDAFTHGVEVVKDGVTSRVKGMPAVEGMAKFEIAGAKGTFGRNMARLGNSPLNAAVQIGIGFTMFRFVGGVVKNLRDRVMNEKNTPEQTVKEVHEAPKTVWKTMKINWAAESTGTPIAALVLGFMNAAYLPTMLAPKRNAALYPGIKGFFTQAHEVVLSKPAKLLQNAAVWTLSYSLFFLTAESLFKDVQLKRGLWKGHPNSLKNGPDDTVGGPGAVNYTPPEVEAEREKKAALKEKLALGEPATISASAEEGYKTPAQDDEFAHDSHQKLRYPWLTGEPSIGRFVFRRVLPVAVGITAYAALKRVGYLADVKLPGMKHNYMADAEKGIAGGWNGPMEPITVETFDKLNSFGDHAKFYLKNAYREGKATIMFGALWASTDAWGGVYDKFVHKLQRPENAVTLNEHQQEKHAELLARVNAKEVGTGRAA